MLGLIMPNHMVEKAREEELFCREDTPTEQRVLGAFLYHAGLLDRQVETVVERSYESLSQFSLNFSPGLLPLPNLSVCFQ